MAGGARTEPAAKWFAGLMSGTSLDGVDAVLARFEDLAPESDAAHAVAADETVAVGALHHHHLPFPAALRAELLALQQAGGHDELARAARASIGLSRHCAATLAPLLEATGISPSAISALGAHGQTVRHRPEHGYTVQLLDGALLAELTGTAVVCDFRSADVAAGGQGAPLVPAFHAALLGTATPRVVVNIGGMANLTLLHSQQPVSGFDCGPGNVLLDAWIGHCLGRPLDADGAWSASGCVQSPLLEQMLAHPFLAKAPPKSCGREAFDLHWLLSLALDAYAPADVQATLAEFTARSIALAIGQHAPATRAVLICGGGARNPDLLGRLRTALANCTVDTTSAIGLDPMHVEAAAFAWLAKRRLEGRPGNLPVVTGAHGLRVLGAVYPAPPA